MVTLKRPRPVFQGWQVIAALFVVGFMLYGGGFYSFILFVPPLAKEFHWSSAGTGGLVSAFFLSAPLSLYAAPLLERFGEKRLIVAGIIVEAVCLIALFSVHGLWQMYLLRALAGVGKVLFALAIPVVIAKWFSRHFGLAVAIAFSGWHIGGLGLAALTQYLLSHVGWRATSIVLGVAQILIALPITLWGLRAASARAIGQNLDGDTDVQSDAARSKSEDSEAPAPYLTQLRALIALPAFQIIAIASPIFYLSRSGVLVHQAAVIDSVGAPPFMASLTLGVTAGCAAIGAILGGWLFDKFSPALNVVSTFFLLGGGIVLLLLATSNPVQSIFLLHALVFGLGVGCGEIFWITMLKRWTPKELFTTAYGAWYFLQLASVIVAPMLAGAIFDFTKSYRGMLAIETAVLSLSFVITLLLARGAPTTGADIGVSARKSI